MNGLEATVSLNQRYRRISGFPSPFLIYWPNNIGHIHILLLTFAEWQLLKPLAIWATSLTSTYSAYLQNAKT